MPKKKTLRDQAYETVLRVRGSNYAPGFDYCVDAELKRLKSVRAGHVKPSPEEDGFEAAALMNANQGCE